MSLSGQNIVTQALSRVNHNESKKQRHVILLFEKWCVKQSQLIALSVINNGRMMVCCIFCAVNPNKKRMK